MTTSGGLPSSASTAERPDRALPSHRGAPRPILKAVIRGRADSNRRIERSIAGCLELTGPIRYSAAAASCCRAG
jgi:hypothetical protein